MLVVWYESINFFDHNRHIGHIRNTNYSFVHLREKPLRIVVRKTAANKYFSQKHITFQRLSD